MTSEDGLFLTLDCTSKNSPFFILTANFDPNNYTYIRYQGFSVDKYNYILTSKKCSSVKWILSMSPQKRNVSDLTSTNMIGINSGKTQNVSVVCDGNWGGW